MKRLVVLSVALVAWAFAAETNFTLPTQPMIGFPGNPRSSSVMQNAVTNQLSIVQYDAAATAALGGEWTVLASAIYNETLLELGWDYLYISPANLAESGQSQAYYAAGYLEGALTNRSITNAGIVGSYEALPDNVRGWIDTHIGYITSRSLAETTPFWVQVGLLMQQIQGLTDGYNMAVGKSAVTFKDMFVASFGDEVGDVNGTFYYPAPHKASRHCSALIKVTDTDLYVAHDTWSSFESMRRVYKVYVFNTTAAFSGYPGQIASGDDWYMTSNGLAIQETTNDFYNNSLYQFIKPRSVSEFLRVMTATYLAADGATWVQLFATENSGTYNNQYMVVNMNLWAPGQKGAKLQDNLLWVAEQIPGYVEAQDVTQVLRDTSYWASYNVAYFPYIYNVSGFLAMYESEGSFWSYTDYARPEIFRREQAGVTTLSDMQKLMRYNHYETDPFSKIPNCNGCPVKGGVATCNPVNSAMLTIASRGDLNPLPNATVDGEPVCYGPLYFVGHRDHAATDSKIATWSNFQNGLLTGVAISGPTGVTQPYFQFSGSGIEQPVGMPNVYNFTWVSFALPVQWYYVAPHTGLPGDNKTVIGVVIAAGVIGAIFGAAAVVVVRRRRQNVVAGYRDLPGASTESRSAGHV